MKHADRKLLVKLYLIIIIASLFCLSSCVKWDSNKVINGIEFSKIRYETLNDDTVAVIGYLVKNKIIEKYPCAKDWVHFTKDWRIKLLRLSENSIINNYSYPKDTWIKFDDEHNVICVFPRNTNVQGYLCKGDGNVKGISTSFYKNGRLHSFYSENDVLIGEVFCLGGMLHNIELFDNGALKECTIARDKEIHGILYNKYTRVSFDENGNIVSTNH